MANILIIDDNLQIQRLLAQHVKKMNHNTAVAESLADGFEAAGLQSFDLIFLDVRLPDGNGLEALLKFRQMPQAPEVIIITGVGDAEGAELAIKSGAWDYIQKPFSKGEIMLQISRALEFRAKKTAAGKVSLKRNKVIGNSPQLVSCLDQVALCADCDTNVLITGETGTGKELFAQTIHDNSSSNNPEFIVVDCAALPDNLIESILFGHVKGAFTGADKDQVGLVKQADGGTLFLDEVGELPLSIQKTFLRTLQEKKFRPVGSSREIKSDFRLISATNQDLDAMVKEGRFRKDLLFRLRTFNIDLPPLRKRPEDVKELTRHFIFRICEHHRIKIKGFAPEFLALLAAYHWPGNVRELINTLEKAIISDPENPTLYPMHLPAGIRIRHAQAAVARKRRQNNSDVTAEVKSEPRLYFSGLIESNLPMQEFREKIIGESEMRYLRHLMDVTQHNVRKACRISGLSSSRLYTLLRKYGIPVKQK
ncbi:MAG: sigma-54-dependent Fis family transcriptional regulator [Deltaproteobacteria bacterium]|nr:sigma-54-dependent Fis family transcriptional regulator [Deltaproteobacteria bacterium]